MQRKHRRPSSASSAASSARTRSRKPVRPTTPRQIAILTFIRDYMNKHGYSPTYEEIAEEFDITKVTVFEHLTILEKRGLVSRDKHKARSLQLADHLELPDERPGCLRIAGRIAAGHPIEAVETFETIDVDQLFTSDHGTFVLQVKGDSMIEDQIAEGDYVVVERRTSPRNGEMVVALLDDGEATLKRYYREKGRIRLQPANPAYEPIYATSVEIQGVVIGVIRKV